MNKIKKCLHCERLKAEIKVKDAIIFQVLQIATKQKIVFPPKVLAVVNKLYTNEQLPVNAQEESEISSNGER